MGAVSLIEKIRCHIFGPRSRFKPGDAVQLQEGEQLMVVTRIYTSRKMSQPIIECHWSEGSTRRMNMFVERALKPFDWYHPRLYEEHTREKHAT